MDVKKQLCEIKTQEDYDSLNRFIVDEVERVNKKYGKRNTKELYLIQEEIKSHCLLQYEKFDIKRKTQMKTYLRRVILNEYFKITNKLTDSSKPNKKTIFFEKINNGNLIASSNISSYESELNSFVDDFDDMLLTFKNEEKFKLIISLKALCGYQIKENDMLFCKKYKDYEKEYHKLINLQHHLIEKKRETGKKIYEKEIHKVLNDFFNKCEAKITTEDNLKKWLNKKIKSVKTRIEDDYEILKRIDAFKKEDLFSICYMYFEKKDIK